MNLSLWTAIGGGAGALAGTYFDNIPIGIAIGIAAGLAVGAIVARVRGRKL